MSKSVNAFDSLSNLGPNASLPETNSVPSVFAHLILRASPYNLHLYLLESRPVMDF